MSRLSAVFNILLPTVRNGKSSTHSNILKCEQPVGDVNFLASKNTVVLRGISCWNLRKRLSGSSCSPTVFFPRAVNQSNLLWGEDLPNKGVDDNNFAAENSADIAEGTIHELANERREQAEHNEDDGSSCDQGQHSKGKGGVLDAVTSTNQAAQTMQRDLQNAVEFASGTEDNHTQAPQNTGDEVDREEQGIGVKAHAQLDLNAVEVNKAHEAERYSIRDGNNALENAAQPERETGTELVNACQDEPEDTSLQDNGSSYDFGDQARRFQENVQEQAQGLVNSIKRRASKQVQDAGTDMLGKLHDDDDEALSMILKLRPKDFDEAYIEIDDGSAKESIHL